jgi:5'-nucleotidase
MRERYGTQLAITNGGGLRSALPSSYAPADSSLDRTDPPPYDIVTGDVFTLLPFGNVVVARTVTGAQLYAALENGVSRMPARDGRFPQISGFRFTFDSRLPAGSRVVSVTLDDGTPVARDGSTYTLATNDFMNAGGDGYTALADGQGTSHEVMADVLLAVIECKGTISPLVDGRIDDLAS